MTIHTYASELSWSGSTAQGYRGYDRTHTATVGDLAPLRMTSDPAFYGDPALLNPEQLLLVAASSCQMLSFLAVAAVKKVDIVSYTDSARAVMPGDVRPVRISEIELRPKIVARSTDEATVRALVARGHDICYIANSINSTITITAEIEIVD